MATYNEGIKSFVAGEALVGQRRVKQDSTVGQVVYADAGEDYIGITQFDAANAARVSVKMKNYPGTVVVTAASAFALAAVLYGAADGKVDDTAVGEPQFVALELASAGDDEIEAQPTQSVTYGAGAGWDIALGTLAGAAADNAFAITVTDSTTFSSGYANMIYLNLTNSGAKTGGCSVSQLNAFASDVSLAAVCNFNGIYIYVDDSGSPDLSSQAIAGANLDLQEMGATDYFTGLWLQKSNTTKGTSVDAFVLASLQGAGVAKSVIHCQGIALPDYFLTLPGSARDMWTSDSPGAGTTYYLKVDLNGSEYKIKLESEAS